MGIPVMSLRGEGISSQNVPWDSVSENKVNFRLLSIH